MTDPLLVRSAKPPTWWNAPWRPGTNQDPDEGWSSSQSNASLARQHVPWWQTPDMEQPDSTSLLAPLARDLDQVRSRNRVRDLAEVFTNQREIDAMLDLMPDAFTALDVKFLEPSCGSGNFLTEVLRRKLRLVSKGDSLSQEQYEHRLLRAVGSIYGVDISPENISEARGRMIHVLLETYRADPGTIQPSTGVLNAAGLIVSSNIVPGDTLNSPNKIELCDWRPHAGGRFQRVWSFALVPPADQDLFWSERVQDVNPVHYSELTPPPKLSRARGKKTVGR